MTYSIVARDQKTGELGVAVQSHFFSVGSIVTWARAGVGVVATQAMVDVKYGPLGLELMSGGRSAEEALNALLKADSNSDSRQVAMVDAKGRVAAHTGSKCLPHAGHVLGDGFSCQGNIMRSERVWGAMKESFEGHRELPLAERMVGALEAAEEAGGDIRGKQSSAILVVSPELKPTYWEGRLIELRVEDHPAPVPELRRLLRYQRGYEWANKGDEYLTAKDYPRALDAYSKALSLVPEIDELKYWVGIGLLSSGRTEEGVEMLKKVIAKDRNWAEVTKGIAKVRSPAIAPEILSRLLQGGNRSRRGARHPSGSKR
jgi:uncharacterized Ntn-hydrolase superfamily protein